MFDLSQNEIKCVNCSDFYEKVMHEKYDSSSFAMIFEHFAFENEMFSCHLAQLILKGLNRANFDEARPYLEAFSNFINIPDHLQLKRIEWILGFPQPITTTLRFGHESYGIYGNTSLEDTVVTYESPMYLEGATSVLNLILQNRRRTENLCIICLKQVLSIAETNQVVFEYLVSLPPPSFNIAKFMDWVPSFIEGYISDARRFYYGGYPKEELGLETMKIYKLFEEKFNKKLEFHDTILSKLQPQLQFEHKEEKLKQEQSSSTSNIQLKNLNKLYIIGQTIKEEKVDSKLFTDPTDDYEITLITTEITCYTTESKPTGNGNLAFPEHVIRDNHIIQHHIKPDTPLTNFVQVKDSTNEKININNNSNNKNKVSDAIDEQEELQDLAPLLAEDKKQAGEELDQIDFDPENDIKDNLIIKNNENDDDVEMQELVQQNDIINKSLGPNGLNTHLLFII